MHKTNLSHSNTRKGHSMKKVEERKRSQAALDYLVSWGWILIIIVAAVIVLFSLGVFRVPSAPTIISGFSGITMQAAQANSTMMVVKLTNNYNQFINLTGITVNVNGNTYKSLDCLNSIISTGQSTLCRIPVSISTSSYLSNIQISFTPYKSSIYEVSNGTVSSTLVSGSIPINNQLTYFVEKGLPYGSTFTVNYNTSTNSTVVSSINDNVSFDLPFGNYYFSVPTVNYQGCVSTPSPVSGYHSTGVGELIRFASNCTTTFSETGLPSSQKWSVSYNGSTASNSTGSSIYIKTKNVTNAQISYTAIAKSDNLVCVSYKTPLVRLGGSYTFSAWNCTTSFSESGLPSNQGWYVTNYDGASSTVVSTGSLISILQYDIPDVSSYTASSSGSPLNELNCSSSLPGVEQGSTASPFSPWTCTTSFTESALPTGSGQYWNASYDSLSGKSSVPNNIGIVQSGITTVSSFSASAVSDNLDCNSQASSVQQGSTVSMTPWTCVTTFDSGMPSGYNSYNWRITYTGTQSSYSSVSSSIAITTTGITKVSNEPVTQGNLNSVDCNYNATSIGYLEGSANTFNLNYWKCVTQFTESGLSSSSEVWAAVYDGSQVVGSNPLSFNTIPGNFIAFVPKDFLDGVSQKFTQTNSPSSLLAGTSGSVSYSTNGVVPPSGIIYYAPITISNDQGYSTPNGFQQMVIINAPDFSYYEASNMQNVEFFYANGQIIPSWLEIGNNSYSSTTYWLKMNSMNAYSSETIYMGFATPSTNLFNGITVGEAPQLSSTYGEYDNGAKIFNAYANGDTNPSDFSVASSEASGSISQSTGVSYPDSASGSINALYDTGAFFPVGYAGYSDTVYNASPLPNQPTIVETNFNIKNALGSDNGIAGLGNYSSVPGIPACSGNSCSGSNSPPIWGIGTQSGGQSTDCGSGGCYQLFQDYMADRYLNVDCSYNIKTGRICTSSASGTYSQGNNEQGSVSGAWQYAELIYDGSSTYSSYVGALPSYIDSSTGNSASVNSGFTFSGSNLYITLLSWTSIGDSYAYKDYFNWMFARDYPPNGVMPSVSIGSVNYAGVGVGSGNSGTYSKYFTWDGGTSNANYYASGGASLEDYYLYDYSGATEVSGYTNSYCPNSISTKSLNPGIYSISIYTYGGGYEYCGDTMAELT